jgi:hypothetical protein
LIGSKDRHYDIQHTNKRPCCTRQGANMKSNRLAALIAFSAALSMPASSFAQHYETSQDRHDRAEAAQTAHDHRHHTGVKVVGGSAAGGAAVGALLGGGKGALIGGAVGAGGGAVANKVRKDKAVRKRERREY